MADSDQIWIEFLSSLYDDSLYKEGEDNEEVNDPEYDITEDLNQFCDQWELTDDRAVKVTEYELDLLFDHEDNQVPVEAIETTIEVNSETIDANVFDKQTVEILVKQLEQHIQLLTQTYLQTINNKGLETAAQNANSMLNEINTYSNSKTISIFSTINLRPAIDLVSDYPIDQSLQTSQSMNSWRRLPVSQNIQSILVSNPNIFLEPWLLPICGYCDIKSDKKSYKTVFTLSEDHLIALGLEQFSPLLSLRKCYRYIKQLLLPIKTVDQIRTRIKNVKRRSNNNDLNDNPIVFYSQNNRAPETDSGIIDPKKDTKIPEWYKKYNKLKRVLDKLDSNSEVLTKKLKGVTVGSHPKKAFITQQSPVKQTNSIVKKYRYLKRINPVKQAITATNIRTEMDSRLEECSTLPNPCYDSNESQNLNKINDSIDTNKQNDGLDIDCDTQRGNEINANVSSVENIDCEVVDQSNMTALNENVINEEDAEFDDESDLAALMTASSTITRTKSKNNSDISNSSLFSQNNVKKEGRKSLAVKQKESTLQLLSFELNESDPQSEQKEEILVHYFLDKVRRSLKNEDFISFLTLLSEFDLKRKNKSSPGLIKQLYHQIEQFLCKLNVSRDIISEFVLFLSPKQAEECDKMFDYLYWKRFFNFVRKLEIYSTVDPQCLQRLFRSLNQLKQNEKNLNKNKIRSTVSRVLNGHLYLMNEFSTLFLDEKPSEYLFEIEDFDEIVVESSDDEERNDSSDKICFENIFIPESDDDLKYGTNECPCKTCHTPNNNSLPFGRHCTSCGIRFIGGRVYLTQSHKKLHLAEIHYHDNDIQSNKLFINNEVNKQIEDEEEIGDSDNEMDSIQLNEMFGSENKIWSISEDKMLLELCRSKVLDEKINDLSDEIFEEVAHKLSKDMNEVIARFNKLMELFASTGETI